MPRTNLIKPDRGDIKDFYILSQTENRYDIVYLGDVFPYSSNNSILNLLISDYVILFTTKLNQNKDSSTYGHVEIEFIRHDHLSYFNSKLREVANFHVLKDDSLILNDFLEVVLERTELGIRIIARLKKQKILSGNDRTVKFVRDFRVLLVKENTYECYDNCKSIELGPEFQVKMDIAKVEERLYKLRETLSELDRLAFGNSRRIEFLTAIEVIKESLSTKIDEERTKLKLAVESYSYYSLNLMYINKESLL